MQDPKKFTELTLEVGMPLMVEHLEAMKVEAGIGKETPEGLYQVTLKAVVKAEDAGSLLLLTTNHAVWADIKKIVKEDGT